jgi:hypothetical protein
MHDDDGTTRDATALKLAAVMDETARLHRELEAVEADLARIVELFLETTGRADLLLDLLQGRERRSTLH